MKAVVTHRGRVTEIEGDSVLVYDDKGELLMVAARTGPGNYAFAHFDDPDFRDVLTHLGYDRRTIVCPAINRLTIRPDGQIIQEGEIP